MDRALANLGIKGVKEVRVGKYIELNLPRASRKRAEAITKEACERLLANPNIEAYRFEIVEQP